MPTEACVFTLGKRLLLIKLLTQWAARWQRNFALSEAAQTTDPNALLERCVARQASALSVLEPPRIDDITKLDDLEWALRRVKAGRATGMDYGHEDQHLLR